MMICCNHLILQPSIEKCNVGALDNMFRTPLHWAAVLGRYSIKGCVEHSGPFNFEQILHQGYSVKLCFIESGIFEWTSVQPTLVNVNYGLTRTYVMMINLKYLVYYPQVTPTLSAVYWITKLTIPTLTSTVPLPYTMPLRTIMLWVLLKQWIICY